MRRVPTFRLAGRARLLVRRPKTHRRELVHALSHHHRMHRTAWSLPLYEHIHTAIHEAAVSADMQVLTTAVR